MTERVLAVALTMVAAGLFLSDGILAPAKLYYDPQHIGPILTDPQYIGYKLSKPSDFGMNVAFAYASSRFL